MASMVFTTTRRFRFEGQSTALDCGRVVSQSNHSCNQGLQVFFLFSCINTFPLFVWPHLFRGAGHEKRRGEQLKWSLACRLYIGSFPSAQLPWPVHTARLYRVCFCVFSLGLCFVCSFVLFWFVCNNVSPFFCFPEQLSHLPYSSWR